MSRLNLRIDTLAMLTIWCVLLLAVSTSGATSGANLTVKSGGGGNFTTIQACATAMAPGDTCTVYAGTYNETVTLGAGTAGNYKTLNVNGSDLVYVQGFVAASYAKIIGFHIQYPSSPGSGCISIPNGTQYLYIRNNVLTECGVSGQTMINLPWPNTGSYIFIQGNTLSFPCVNSGSINHNECDSVYATGDHWLIENNDFSHYTLSVLFLTKYAIFRNNTFHDQYETEAAGNYHTDTFFSEPGVSVPVQYNVMEGNYQYNAFGPDAKGLLAQNEGCGGTCYNIIERFNIVSRIGGGVTSNDANPGWPYFKVYNNTFVDPESDITSSNPVTDNHTYGGAETSGAPSASELNNLFYYSRSTGGVTAGWGPYSTGNVSTDVYGYNLVWCPSCSTIYSHLYGSGSWTSDPGNKNANPLFVNYVSPGSLSNDYHLQAGSPAIAAGTYLTTVASGDTGSGTSLVVNDASYFQDGYGLSNAYSTVQADCISVTTVGNHVCITAINYSTNTLTLSSPIARTSGDAVWLYSKSDGVQVLTRSAPDLGAYPYGGGGTTPAPPTNVSAVVH